MANLTVKDSEHDCHYHFYANPQEIAFSMSRHVLLSIFDWEGLSVINEAIRKNGQAIMRLELVT
jgi:hypothetical protein